LTNLQSRSMKLHSVVLLGILLASCARQRTSQGPLVSLGGVGTLVVVITDSTGSPRAANAYLAEDPRLASGAVTYGTAGVWADEKEGVARLGTWRPGKYTLVVRRIGYNLATRSVTLSAGRADTVRIELRPSNITLQTPITTPPQTQSRIRLDGPPPMSSLPVGERLAIQFNEEPPIIQVSDGHGGPPIKYHGQALTNDRIKAIYVLKAKQVRERFGDQTLAGAILIELKDPQDTTTFEGTVYHSWEGDAFVVCHGRLFHPIWAPGLLNRLWSSAPPTEGETVFVRIQAHYEDDPSTRDLVGGPPLFVSRLLDVQRSTPASCTHR